MTYCISAIYGYLGPKGVSTRELLERHEVWRKLGNTPRGIDKDPFHPECLGYTVVKVAVGELYLTAIHWAYNYFVGLI